MAFETLWLTSAAGAVTYTASEFRHLITRIFTTGVLEGLAVTQSGTPAMTVQMAAGSAIIPPATNEGRYLAYETAATLGIVIPAAPVTAGQTRHDIVCLKTNDPAAPGGSAGRNTVPVVVSGVASATPTDPAIPAFHLPIARVVNAFGTAAITNAMIVDLRAFATLALDVVDDINATRLGTSVATVNTIVRRDAAGRAKFVAPAAAGDAAIFPVTTAQIGADQITAALLAANSVGTSELIDANVTAAKLAAGAAASNIGAGGINGFHIAGSSIDASKLAADSVGASEIAAGAVGPSELAAATGGTLAGGQIGYRILGDIVHVYSIGTGWNSATAATLPVGYRPSAAASCAGYSQVSGTAGYITVNTDGTIVAAGGGFTGTTQIRFSMSYPAA